LIAARVAEHSLFRFPNEFIAIKIKAKRNNIVNGRFAPPQW